MNNRKITCEAISLFERYLMTEEKSKATIQKYVYDLKNFADYSNGINIDKNLTLGYKMYLKEKYAITSANSMIASLNAYLRFEGWQDCCIKAFKIQNRAYCSQEDELTKEEYIKLLTAARAGGKERLYLLIQTICCTGIRVSELEYITVEALAKGEAQVNCKGKVRKILIISELCEKLKLYAAEKEIEHGPIFITRSGKPMNRCNIWREMKQLCVETGINQCKVYPHNLRHLFARTFYDADKDIAKLADVLGHTNINTTRVYIITSGEEHKRKMEQLGLVL